MRLVRAIAGIAFGLLALAPLTHDAVSAASQEPVSTSIADAVQTAPWLAVFLQGTHPDASRSISFMPGYHRISLQSYCLHAGAYGPTSGEGYLLAPLLGGRGALIGAILHRSAAQPQIAQEDIQRLIWGIEAEADYNDFPADFRDRVAPLLRQNEIASLTHRNDTAKNVATSILGSFIPAPVSAAVSEIQNIRAQITDAGTTYAELKDELVKTGEAPRGEGSRDIPAGTWSYAGHGLYVRFFPDSYSKTAMEALQLPSYRLRDDAQGRITHLESGAYRIDATYEPRPSIVVYQNQKIRAWRFKTLRLTGRNPGQSKTLQNRGYVLDSRDLAYSSDGQFIHTYFSATALSQQPYSVASLEAIRAIDVGEATGVVGGVERVYDVFGKFSALKDAHEIGSHDPQEAAKELSETTHLVSGVRDAIQGSPEFWIVDTYLRAVDITVAAGCELSDCSGADQPSNEPVSDASNTNWADPPLIAAPGNTSLQRLGISARLAP